ncbi:MULTISPECIES: DUF808 domain-containing protein [unclassified Pseudoalteromonas]|uniref:DUF808 domain-containing protein n=1 Tax=unclassified Pseudoalteromonas TaxID=194690 RepID=UPI000CF67A57|nr:MULTISPECIES: DUF808 domain-containing protein [unclassified Pseudoalteromonas]
MAGASLLTLLDDITALLDDIATMSKVATKKTAGVLGDDLALNAQQVSGVNADRELPVVWAVAKGSMLNKAILVPAALLISAFIPWLITPLLMLGGLFLCFEGAEKLAHGKEEQPEHPALAEPLTPEAEKEKIKGAIRTDFILSAEIIVISLGTVATASFIHQVSVLSIIAVVMTVGVYGLVAGIVKLDDAGLYLLQRGVAAKSAISRAMGRFLLTLAPWLMKALAVLGTIAMFLVGGGILVHGIAPLHHLIGHWGELAGQYGGVVEALVVNGANGLVGLLAGFVVVIALHLFKQLKK